MGPAPRSRAPKAPPPASPLTTGGPCRHPGTGRFPGPANPMTRRRPAPSWLASVPPQPGDGFSLSCFSQRALSGGAVAVLLAAPAAGGIQPDPGPEPGLDFYAPEPELRKLRGERHRAPPFPARVPGQLPGRAGAHPPGHRAPRSDRQPESGAPERGNARRIPDRRHHRHPGPALVRHPRPPRTGRALRGRRPVPPLPGGGARRHRPDQTHLLRPRLPGRRAPARRRRTFPARPLRDAGAGRATPPARASSRPSFGSRPS